MTAFSQIPVRVVVILSFVKTGDIIVSPLPDKRLIRRSTIIVSNSSTHDSNRQLLIISVSNHSRREER